MPLLKFPLVAVVTNTCQPDLSSDDLAGSLFPGPFGLNCRLKHRVTSCCIGLSAFSFACCATLSAIPCRPRPSMNIAARLRPFGIAPSCLAALMNAAFEAGRYLLQKVHITLPYPGMLRRCILRRKLAKNFLFVRMGSQEQRNDAGKCNDVPRGVFLKLDLFLFRHFSSPFSEVSTYRPRLHRSVQQIRLSTFVCTPSPIPVAANLPAGISAPAPRCVRAPRLRFLLPGDRGTFPSSRRPIRHRSRDRLPGSAAARQSLVYASLMSGVRSCVPVDTLKMGHLPRSIHEKSTFAFSIA